MKRPSPRRPRIASRDYHDYFIKDGAFIGKFEEMYRNVEDPWHIGDASRLDQDVALTLLRSTGEKFASALDVGCGKGAFTHRLRQVTGGEVHAVDVSATAIRKARQRYPGIHFAVLDANRIEALPHPAGSFDLIVMAQMVWCVLPSLVPILVRFHALLKATGSLLVTQHFLQPGQQAYGRGIIETPEHLLRFLGGAGFEVKRSVETDRWTNHHLAVWAKPLPRPRGR